jgi:hypothetical protein
MAPVSMICRVSRNRDQPAAQSDGRPNSSDDEPHVDEMAYRHSLRADPLTRNLHMEGRISIQVRRRPDDYQAGAPGPSPLGTGASVAIRSGTLRTATAACAVNTRNPDPDRL